MSIVKAPMFENLKSNHSNDINLLLKRHKEKLQESRNKVNFLVAPFGKSERKDNPYENLVMAPSGR